MFILTNVELNITAYGVTVPYGTLINVNDEVGEKIISAGYGRKLEFLDLENRDKDESKLTITEIKDLLDAEGIKYDSKAKKEELLKLLPQK